MKNINTSAIACRHCQHYRPEGRRGGHCQRLDALVRGSWEACPLMALSFSSAWEPLEGAIAQKRQSQIGYPIEVIPAQRLVKNHLLRRNPSVSKVLTSRKLQT